MLEADVIFIPKQRPCCEKLRHMRTLWATGSKYLMPSGRQKLNGSCGNTHQTQIFWQIRAEAHPTLGALPSTCPLTDLNGTELEMGTDFDAFTPLSHHGAMDISATAQRNRHLLMGIMTTAGWDFYRNEWWHYQLFDSRDYPLLSDSVLDESMMRAPHPSEINPP